MDLSTSLPVLALASSPRFAALAAVAGRRRRRQFVVANRRERLARHESIRASHSIALDPT